MFAGNPGPAAELADRALASGAATEPIAIMALHIRGDSRIALGDPDGIEDLHEALRTREALGSVSEIVTSLQLPRRPRVAGRGPGGGPRAPGCRRASSPTAAGRSARGRGPRSPRSSCWSSSGRWDEMLARAEPLASDGRMDESLVVAVDIWTTLVELLRGRPVGDVDDILARARAVEELQVLAPALALCIAGGVRCRRTARGPRRSPRSSSERPAARPRCTAPSSPPRWLGWRSPPAPPRWHATSLPGPSRSRCATSCSSTPRPRRCATPRATRGQMPGPTSNAAGTTTATSIEEAQAALALGRTSNDEAAIARGRRLFDALGVPE